MKIAVSARGKTLDSEVDPRFGRCEGFVLLDDSRNSFTYLDNSQARDREKVTGVTAAKLIAEAGASVLITGQMGPKALKVLQKSDIEIYESSHGTVREALRALAGQNLSKLTKDKVKTGPGKRGGRGVGGGGRGGGIR